VPRKVVANAALLCADIDVLTTINDFKKALDNVTKVIIRWNTQMKYIERNGNKNEGGNCQEFVDDILTGMLFTTSIKFAVLTPLFFITSFGHRYKFWRLSNG